MVGAGTMAGGGAPLILVVASDDAVRRRLVADVAHRFDADYAVAGAAFGGAALDRLRARPEVVAAVIAHRRLADMAGVDLLAQAYVVALAAKRGLLLAFQDLDANEALLQAATFGRVDGWEWWDPAEPREERLYPLVEALLAAWSLPVATSSGSRRSPSSARGGAPAHTSCATCCTATVSRSGSRRATRSRRWSSRTAAGWRSRHQRGVGRGARGATRGRRRAAATSRSSAPAPPAWPPRSTARPRVWTRVLLEAEAIGGQAGTSSMIRNYLGFPRGMSGESSWPGWRTEQATQLGARFVYARVNGLEPGSTGTSCALRTAPGFARAWWRSVPG